MNESHKETTRLTSRATISIINAGAGHPRVTEIWARVCGLERLGANDTELQAQQKRSQSSSNRLVRLSSFDVTSVCVDELL